MLDTPDRDFSKGNNYSERVIEIIIHEARNLLTTINFSSEILMEVANPEEQALARSIHKSGKRLSDLFLSYQKLLLIVKGEYACELEEELIFNKLSTIIDDFEKDLRRKDLNVMFDRKDTYEALVTDWFCLDFALRNILKNAIEASPQSGAITLNLQKRFDGFYIEVHNSGAIPPEIIPFFLSGGLPDTQTNKRGMGSYITRKMIDALGGEVTFTTSQQNGTHIRIKLP